jgi:cyclophilin family peptidyl-prolyl cis-trans isomerase
MAKHKAPTEVLVAPVEERGAFFVFLERYWKLLTVGFVVLAGAILYRAYNTAELERFADAGWEELRSVIQIDSSFGVPRVTLATTPENLEEFAARNPQGAAAPWALAFASMAYSEQSNFGKSAEVSARLVEQYPSHPLVSEPWAETPDGQQLGLAIHLSDRARAFEQWKERHPGLFDNPPPPADAPKVILETSAGRMDLALYPDRAPQHVENFLSLVREGYYDGTRFHRVIPGFMVQGGDPNTRQMDPTTWGQGGPDYKVPAEPNDLRHFRLALAAAKMPGDQDSSGSQFYITVGTPHHLDGQHTVFGRLVAGESTLQRISGGEVEPGTDRPKDAVRILSAKVLGEQ